MTITGCATEPSTEILIAKATPAVSVQARGETAAVATANADAADDPAIWRNAADPRASLIVGTDKKAGLHVYGLDGADRFFIDAGAVNNVDLRADVAIAGTPGILVAASDRNDLANSQIALFRLDPATAQLAPLGNVASGAGEAYGVCFYRTTAALYAFMVAKDGTINQVELDVAGATPRGRIVRTLKLGTQSEGCVADERTGRLYVAEEDVGLWRFDANPAGSTEATRIAAVDGRNLVADAEGLAIATEGETGGYLIVSSQGDNAYVLYRLEDDSYVGRFRIAPGKVGGVEETDGIELIPGDFGPDYPGGLFVAQDGHNLPKAQNFKLLAWDDIKKAFGLR
ncbi:phytase [Sphingomonas cavernae]|uniref:phytase n=1 Tax=Sphingomonas cavernae TaxID=2320861 RepID=UPI001EE63116|nr:phytase [Sphingomonas cavernae]